MYVSVATCICFQMDEIDTMFIHLLGEIDVLKEVSMDFRVCVRVCVCVSVCLSVCIDMCVLTFACFRVCV